MKTKIQILIISFILLTEFYVNPIFNSKTFEFLLVIILLLTGNYIKYTKLQKASLLLFLLAFNFLSIHDFVNYGSELIKLLTCLIFYLSLNNNYRFKKILLKYLFNYSLYLSILVIVFAPYASYIIYAGDITFSFDYTIGIIFIPIFLSELKVNQIKLYSGILMFVYIAIISDWRAIQLALFLIIIYYLLNYKSKAIKAILFIGFIYFGSIVTTLYNNNQSSIQFVIENSDITSGRAYLWAKSLAVFNKSNLIEKFFGHGLGQYPNAINSITYNPIETNILGYTFRSDNNKSENSSVHAHNSIINILIENGLIGLIIYIFFYIKILKNISKGFFQKQSYYLAFFAFTISGLFTSITYFNLPYIWIFHYFSKTSKKIK